MLVNLLEASFKLRSGHMGDYDNVFMPGI